MGFPMVDLPSTDISRYFYIASKFIENGINSGGLKFVHFDNKITLIITFNFIIHRKSVGTLHGGNVSICHMCISLLNDFT
jgi:hypothetical protein